MSLAIQLNDIEINNNSLDDICHSLLVLTGLEITDANHYRIMLAPLVEFMSELIDSNKKAIDEIDKLRGQHETR